MDRNLALNLARVTESAALAAARHMGRGDSNMADQAAVDAMRTMFDTVNIKGEVVIGEGEIDNAPMLYTGEQVGLCGADSIPVDIAVDPLDGTKSIAEGRANAISVIAVAPRGMLLHAPDTYMYKMATGPAGKGKIDITKSVTHNIKVMAKALDKDVTEITVLILDRPRHDDIIAEIRAAGSRIVKISDGDVLGAMQTCFPSSGIDLMVGIGGAPEGVLAAAALKCLGGEIQGKLMPKGEKQLRRVKEMGITDLEKVYNLEDMVKGDSVVFSATGVSEGELLEGVKFHGGNIATTETLVLRSETGTRRMVKAHHQLDKKPDYARY